MPAPDPCVIVIFGASGDLTSRKLIPALVEMNGMRQFPAHACVLGIARSPMSDQEWREELEPWVREHEGAGNTPQWNDLAPRIHYLAADATDPAAYPAIGTRIGELNERYGCRGNILIYMAVAPSLYEPILDCIDQAGLVTEGKRWCSLDRSRRPWQRIVVEKPIGHDADSAAGLNRALGRVFEEEAIYRIDHYLGKEVVQSLLALRFANTMLEPVWNNMYVDHVQITAAETVGVGQRVSFYDHTGAIRDMIQSHLLQVLGLVAMEPPSAYLTHNIRSEKVKVIEAIRVPPAGQLQEFAALGQHGGDEHGPAYHDLPGVAPGSTTETFAAIAFEIDNWRWAGTPFYLRTGKRMAVKRTEVVVQFKPPAANIFRSLPGMDRRRPPNRIVIQVGPRAGVAMRLEGKVPGSTMKLGSITMDFDYVERFGAEPVEAYGPLILDVMRGDQTLFKSRFEVEGSWAAVMPYLGAASAPLRTAIHANYAPGSWGPAAADALLARHGRRWHNAPVVEHAEEPVES